MSIFFNKLIKSTEKFAAGALQEKNCRYNSVFFTAQVAKLVDAGDSKSPAARCVGSSPTLGTMENKPRFAVIFLPVISVYASHHQIIHRVTCHVSINKHITQARNP